ncbi:MAG: tetratricopeptide repeat protein [Woeseiaceae bacterium]|jgi:Flp pilus assembly protein TadD
MTKATTLRSSRAVVACLCLAACAGLAQENKTVIGPTNEDLAAGADALLAGDAEEGVRRTLTGLDYATSQRDRVAGMSNLCAAYAMLKQPETGLPWCDQALELRSTHWRALSNRALIYIQLGRLEEAERDLSKAEEIAPNARTVKLVRSILLDLTDPVAPLVVIDDRRQGADDDDE